MIKNWEKFNEGKSNVLLSDSEKEFLWIKMEVKKKKKNLETKSDMYNQLKGDMEISEQDFIKILDSLEYSMKKRIKDPESKAPHGSKYESDFNSIRKKLPHSWVGVKYSNVELKNKRDLKKGES